MSAIAGRPLVAVFAIGLVIAAVAGGLWILGRRRRSASIASSGRHCFQMETRNLQPSY